MAVKQALDHPPIKDERVTEGKAGGSQIRQTHTDVIPSIYITSSTQVLVYKISHLYKGTSRSDANTCVSRRFNRG